MIGISKLYCGTVEPSDAIRYQHSHLQTSPHLRQSSKVKKPVVVWNCTRRCNLRCRHCYAGRDEAWKNATEMSTNKGRDFLRNLADFGSPVVLFSGGEPVLREDIFKLIQHAAKSGLRTALSTNGTLIDPDVASQLRDVGISYVGVSLDGIGTTHNKLRRADDAFEKTMQGIHNCMEAGIKVGIRFTLTRTNAGDIPDVFSLLRREGIPRVCFYHLVYAGRATDMVAEDLSAVETRGTVDNIIEHTRQLYNERHRPEVLTVDNHADGPYLYLRMLQEKNPRAPYVFELLQRNGGSASGDGIACVSWDGSVHPDQFWRHLTLGNVKDRNFSDIWTDLSNPVMAKLKEKKRYVKGRCSQCRFLDLCGGNCRTRAEAVTGDVWGADPACYLTDDETCVSRHSETAVHGMG